MSLPTEEVKKPAEVIKKNAQRVIVAAPSEAEVAALKSQHGEELHALELCGALADGTPLVTVVVRLPNRQEYRRFKDAAANRNGDARIKATEQLARSCIVYPSPERLEYVAEKYAAVLDSVAGELLELAGAQNNVAKKAL